MSTKPPITPQQIADIAKTHGEHIETLRAYAAQQKDNPGASALVGYAITALHGAKEVLDGHVANVAAAEKAVALAAEKAADTLASQAGS